MTDGGGDSCLFEGILELLDHDFARWLEAIAHNPFTRIVGNEVHMCEFAFEELRELMCELRTICDSGDHDIFIKYPLIRLLDILVERLHQHIDRIGILDGHDALSRCIVRCVE